jgi:hypothetical protein
MFTDEEDTLERWIPARPALSVKGAFVRVVLRGHGQPAWEFGEGENLGEVLLMTLDEQGNPIDKNGEALFPGGDFEDDPEYKLLLRYVDVADAETFDIVSDFTEPVREASREIDGFMFERPLVAIVSDAVSFKPTRCHVWRSGLFWDGVTLFGDSVADGLLSKEEFDRMAPRVGAFLRNSALDVALERALEPFPDRAELLKRARECLLSDEDTTAG